MIGGSSEEKGYVQVSSCGILVGETLFKSAIVVIPCGLFVCETRLSVHVLRDLIEKKLGYCMQGN